MTANYETIEKSQSLITNQNKCRNKSSEDSKEIQYLGIKSHYKFNKDLKGIII